MKTSPCWALQRFRCNPRKRRTLTRFIVDDRYRKRSRAGNPRRQHSADCDDALYVGTGCHVTAAASGTGGKRGAGGVGGYCDCATAWTPGQDLLHRTNLIWQTSTEAEETPSPTTLAGKTIYCRHTASGRAAPPPKSTPDLFVDACRPETPPPSGTSTDTCGRVKTSTHLYESPVFSQFGRGLLH